MKRIKTTRAHGFTLLELLVAIAIFSFLATVTFAAINQIIIEREIVEERATLLKNLQRTVRYLNSDFSQLHPRSVRDELGRDRNPALVNDPSAELEVRLSHDGWRNPAQQPRGSLQRVQYRLEDEALIREYWPVMDHMLGDEPRTLELLKNVSNFEIAFLQEGGDWTENWPPPVDESEQYPVILPKAVRYKFNLEGFGKIERLVEVL